MIIDCNCTMRIAMLNNNIVDNITVGKDINEAIEIAKMIYGENGDAKDTYGWKVGIGDIFKDFQWFHSDGTECEREPSGEERVGTLEGNVSYLQEIVNVLIFPPTEYDIENPIVGNIAYRIKRGERSIDEVPEDRGLRKAVEDYMREWFE